mgnify:CR=1 FL=1
MTKPSYKQWLATCAFTGALLLTGCSPTPATKDISIVPLPNKMQQNHGAFVLTPNAIIGTTNPELLPAAEYLKGILSVATGYDIQVKEGKGDITLSTTAIEGKEGAYTLTAKPGQIEITGNSYNGVIAGIESLRQLFPPQIESKQVVDSVTWTIPAVQIEDAPRFEWRGIMLDVSRHFYTKEEVKELLDVMALYKMNKFHWHLTDDQGWRIEIKKYPKLTEIGAVGNWHDAKAAPQFYTQDDIREIVTYAAERQIMVIPEFDMPGHATAVCRAYPEVSGGGEGRWKHFTFHPCKEETYRFISDVLDEITALFPAPYIHIGGDEVHYGNQNWFTDPDIQNFIKEKGLVNETGLEHYFIRRAADLVAAKGKKMIGWDEIVDAGISPSKALVMWWRHDRKYQLLKALEQGYQVVLTPRRPLYGDFVQDASHKVGRYWDGFNPLQDVYAFPEPISHLFKGYEDQILGMQFTLWTERIADAKRLDFMTFPRLIALAESAWTSPGAKDWSRFCMRLPSFLDYLKEQGIYYFDVIHPQETPEPGGPEKADVLQNG